MTPTLAKQEGKLSNSTKMEYINPDSFSTPSLEQSWELLSSYGKYTSY